MPVVAGDEERWSQTDNWAATHEWLACSGVEPRRSGTVADMLGSYLAGEGVEYVFGIPGGAISPLYESLACRSAIRPVLAKHESGATFMADGYARVSGGLGVACATTGPGATNALTGVACAYADSVPMLLVTAQVARRNFGRGAMQESTRHGVDLVSLFAPATRLSTMIVDASSAERTVQTALRAAMSGRPGPVHLSMPVDIAQSSIGYHRSPPESYRTGSRPAMVLPDVERVLDLLEASRRPALLVGSGVVRARAWDALAIFAEETGVAVATTPKAKGVFSEDHPLSLGVFGYSGHPAARAYLLEQADLVIAVGSSLGEWQTHAWDRRLATDGKLVQIDIDARELGKNFPLRLGVVADAGQALTMLTVGHRQRAPSRRPEPPRGRAGPADRADLLEVSGQETFSPRALVEGLNTILSEDTIVFADIGSCITWSVHFLRRSQPDTFHINLGFVSMGHGLCAAIGGKLAAPDRPVVALVGDGAFAMNGLEIHTAVELGLDIVWIVLNNAGLGMVHHGDRLFYDGAFDASSYGRPLDIATIARGLGARSVTVRRYPEFCVALARALAEGGPQVIDAHVDPAAVPHPVAERVQALKGTDPLDPCER